MSNYRRRDFLKLSTGLLGGLTIGSMACNNESKTDTTTTNTDSSGAKNLAAGTAVSAFGLQLYTLRDDLPKDPKGILKQIADMGYKQVEGYEGDKGILWGMTPSEFKSYMDSIGLAMVATHYDGGGTKKEDFEKKVEMAAEVGMKCLIFPWEGSGKTINDYKKYAEDFNKNGEVCKKHGIRYAFHNHDYSFKAINGEYPQDILMKNTDASLVDFEMDIYWVVATGEDPEAWIKKYPNRFTSCHLKDRSKTPVEDNGLNSTDLGTGSIDLPKIAKTASQNGMQYYIVEQEAYPNGTPLEAAKANAEYMKKFKI